jgi:serine phosphatase RsbU (regulator of sigma subunit)
MHFVSIVVAIVGAVVLGSLVWLTGLVNGHTQSRLLATQTDAAGVVLGEAVRTIGTPLTTAVAVADASHGDVAAVERYVLPDVGKRSATFDSLSLWRITSSEPVLLMQLGQPTRLSTDPSALERIFANIRAPETLSVVDLVSQTPPRLGYAVESIGSAPRYAVFAESRLPRYHRARVPRSSVFHDLRFSLYLGRQPRRSHLLESTTPGPTAGATASVRVPFGTTWLDLVTSARHPLGGGVLPALPWIIGIVGAALLAAAVVMTEWLMRRRSTAEQLAGENLRLYAEQRSISQTLQSALLPKRLPAIEGVAFAARYVPGDTSADIGGDWYDVIRCDNRSFLFAIGDVSGRGLPAANTMASMHYAIRAYAAQGDDAETILHKLTALLDVARDGHFATVLLGHVDVPDHRVTAVSAGHLPPLVISDKGTEYVPVVSGAPIGVSPSARYQPVTVSVPSGATLLAYTDGLVERRGEHLDVGLERLRHVAGGGARGRSGTGLGAGADPTTPERLLDRVVSMLDGETAADDVALLAMSWSV